MDAMTGAQLVTVMRSGEDWGRIQSVLREIGAPTLTGSEKQVEWAGYIRAQAVQSAIRCMAMDAPKGQKDAYAAQAARMVLEHSTEAKWWIDHRDKAEIILDFLKAQAKA